MDPILIGNAKNYLEWFEFIHEYNNEIEMDFNIINKNELKGIDNSDIENESTNFYLDKEIDTENYEKVDKLLNWKYEFEKEINAPSKTSVTALKNSELVFEDDTVIIKKTMTIGQESDAQEYTETDIAEIAENVRNKTNNKVIEKANIKNKVVKINNGLLGKEEKALTPAEKGSLVHLVLQKLENTEIKNTIEKLKVDENSKEYLQENLGIFENYISSELFKELQEAKEIQKETPFYMYVKYDDTSEKVLIQGIIDLYYINKNDELILVDYKTDRNVDENILKERYYNQLNLYKKALEKSMKRRVTKMYVYSTWLNEQVQI